jgi:hypothetical protein
VLCDVIEPQAWNRIDDEYVFEPRADFGSETEYADTELPRQYHQMVGLDEEMMMLLMRANDGVFEYDVETAVGFVSGKIQHVSFTEIADLLENLQRVSMLEVSVHDARVAFVKSVTE